jgi:hypothetical protein
MELKVARAELKDKPKKIDLKKIEDIVEKQESAIFYFDRDNSHKDLLALQDHIEGSGKSFYMKEVKFGLLESEYMYEVHIIK